MEMRPWVEVAFGGCSDEGRGAGQARGEMVWVWGGVWKVGEAVLENELDPDLLLCGDRIPNCTVWGVL